MHRADLKMIYREMIKKNCTDKKTYKTHTLLSNETDFDPKSVGADIFVGAAIFISNAMLFN